MSVPVRVLVLPWDGDEAPCRIETIGGGDLERLTAMQALVGGYVEAVPLDTVVGSGTLWMNEDYAYTDGGFWTDEAGRQHPKINSVATAFCKGRVRMTGGFILGQCFVTGKADRHGNATHVPKGVVGVVDKAIRAAGRAGVAGIEAT